MNNDVGEAVIDEVERNIYKEVSGAEYLSEIGLKHELDVDPEGVIYDVICKAFDLGFDYAHKEISDAITICEKVMKEQNSNKKFKVVAYVRAEDELNEPMSYEDCEKELESLEMMSDGETLYKIEEMPSLRVVGSDEATSDPLSW